MPSIKPNAFKKTALAGLCTLVALIGTASSANASLISFSSSGKFSDIVGCSGSGNEKCQITSNNTLLDMSGEKNSTLTAVSRSATGLVVPTSLNDYVVGEIDWVNRASTNTDPSFNVNYTFTLKFTSPTNVSDSQLFSLNIAQPTNPSGDNVFGISNATLNGLGPFNLAGVTVSDIRFSLNPGDTGSYNGIDWSNPEGSTSKLYITADFTAVPEPASLALLGLGITGTGVAARRRRQPAPALAGC